MLYYLLLFVAEHREPQTEADGQNESLQPEVAYMLEFVPTEEIVHGCHEEEAFAVMKGLLLEDRTNKERYLMMKWTLSVLPVEHKNEKWSKLDKTNRAPSFFTSSTI